MKELVIGLDVDDVVADLLTPWMSIYTQLAKRTLSPDPLSPEMLESWDIEGRAKHPDLVRQALKEVDYQHMVRPIGGSLAAVGELRKLGRVIFVTACPQLYSAQPKYRWLLQHGFLPSDGSGQVDYFPVRDKKMVRMDYLFDDGDHNIKSCSEAGIKAVVVRRPHNRNFEWTNNVPGIYAAPQWVRDDLSGK